MNGNSNSVENPICGNDGGIDLQDSFCKGETGADARKAEIGGGSRYNIEALSIISFLFGAFVICEIIGALASNSLSLLGDAAAMSVDVFSYFANMYAERVKARDGDLSIDTRWILQVYIPLFSVVCLLGVTAWITSDAISVIISPSDDDDVNVLFLYPFAAGNMIIDIISYYLFHKNWSTVFNDEAMQKKSRGSVDYINDFEIRASIDSTNKKNLNMMSAFTHVGGDTLRTSSVFVAAIIATLGGASGELCDAWAANVVTVTIIGMVIPLLQEIRNSSISLKTMAQADVPSA